MTFPRDGWEADAACATIDPELWHPTREGGAHQARKAKAICATCPVRLDCLADTPIWDHDSIRGGLTGRDREKLRAAAA